MSTWPSRSPAAALLVVAACTHDAPTRCPRVALPGDPALRVADDSRPRPSTNEVALVIAFDADRPGRINLTVSFHGRGEVEVELPKRPDQIEWFDPMEKRLEIAMPRVMWTVWNPHTGALVYAPHPSALRASDSVTLREEDSRSATADLGVALAAERFRGTWCTRAWLVGGALAVPSNIVCLPAEPG